MAIMSAMAWRAIDGLFDTQRRTKAASDTLLVLHTGLQQWQMDLEAMTETQLVSPIDFDGRVLRITRRVGDSEAVAVVAWQRTEGATNADGTPRPASWGRWASAPVTTRGALFAAWETALRQDAAVQAQVVPTAEISDWALYFFQANAWTNPQSAGDTLNATSGSQAASAPAGPAASAPVAPPPKSRSNSPGGLANLPPGVGPAVAAPPDGVRLVIVPAAGPLAGTSLSKDWARPASIR